MPSPVTHSASPYTKRHGFTLVELLTVIAIIGILVAILLPTVSHIRQSARQTHDLATIRSIGQSMVQYASDNRGIINAWGYESGKATSIENSFWGRAWPYLRNTQLKQLSDANMKEVANSYIPATISYQRPELIGNADGINYAIAFNNNLRSEGGSVPNSSLKYTNFERLQNIPRPAMAPYVAIGYWGFWATAPKPLSEATKTEGVYWPFNGNRTAMAFLDGHVENFEATISNNELWKRSLR